MDHKTGPSQKFAVIYSEEENSWVSMAEASRHIVSYWSRYETDDLKLEVINLSQTQIHLKQLAFLYQFLVIAKITPRTAELIKQARKLNPEVKLVIHGLESASLYFANLKLYGLEEYLTDKDLWVMSCEADQKLADETFAKIQTVVVPLASPQMKAGKTSAHDLLFFGRISAQKNIHDTINAVALLAKRMRQEKRKFKIYGYEDQLGVPHLGITDGGYLRYLKRLVRKLKIEDLVEFHGFLTEAEIDRELTTGIFISPSVHSDENFGLVAFRALNQAYPVILSNWGGHQELTILFPQGIALVDVYHSQSGPVLNPVKLAQQIQQSWDQPAKVAVTQDVLPMIDLATLSVGESLHRKIEIKRHERKHAYYGQLFKNYQDPLFIKAAEIYGAQKPVRPVSVLLAPNVRVNKNSIHINDPLHPHLKLARQDVQGEKLVKQIGKRKSVKLTQGEWQWLVDHGKLYEVKGQLC